MASQRRLRLRFPSPLCSAAGDINTGRKLFARRYTSVVRARGCCSVVWGYSVNRNCKLQAQWQCQWQWQC